MAIWTGLGINYGYDLGSATYNTAQAETDLSFLKSQGITRIRITYPGYANANGIANCQDLVLRALNHGFYTVWGISTGVVSPNLTATIWAAYKPVVTGTIASWAQAHGLSELSMGNECDFQVDGTTLTAATVRSDVRAMASTVKSGGYTGVVSYNTPALGSIRTSWASEGLGSLDLIGWNNYGTLANFTNFNPLAITAFGAGHTYVSEFGSMSLGYGDYNDENAYATDVLARITALQSAGMLSGYFFCYHDESTGPSANTFGLVQANGVAHCVRGAILNTPGQKIFSMFAM